MTMSGGLLRLLWRQALPATLLGALSLGIYALTWREVMTVRDLWPALFVLIQCLLLGVLLGKFQTPAFAFVHSRGYSRDVLWTHLMLTSALSVLAAWLPATLILCAGLRSVIHDRLLHSPYFPIMAPRETWVPLVWLGLFMLLVPAVHYAWIRYAQPTKGGHGGSVMTIGIMAALLVAFAMVYYLNGWFAWLSGVLYVVAVVSLILGCRVLYRSLEVRT